MGFENDFLHCEQGKLLQKFICKIKEVEASDFLMQQCSRLALPTGSDIVVSRTVAIY